jgi:type III secretory pathway component EscR
MTTNKSALEFGFYLFTGFVLLGLVISAFMDREVSEMVPPGASEKGE